jgi:hypothetical protein
MKSRLRDLLLNKVPVFVWRGSAAPDKNWDFTGILFYGKPISQLFMENQCQTKYAAEPSFRELFAVLQGESQDSSS